MITGIGPVLGEGIIGWIIYNDREYEREYRNGAATSFGETFASVATPYTLARQHPKVAVLTDGVVASAGEAIVVFFRGRPDCARSALPRVAITICSRRFPLTDGATLFLVWAARGPNKKEARGPIGPDEMISDPREAVNRAIAWLLAGS